MAVLTRKGRPNVEGQFGKIKREADNIGVKLKRAHVGPDDDIDDVFADFKKDTVGVESLRIRLSTIDGSK